MARADLISPADLTPAQAGLWREMRAATPAFASPLLGPDFAAAVAAERADAAVAVLRQGERIVGFFPYHRRFGGLARPIGAPFSDYHAVVTEPSPAFDAEAVLAAAALTAFRFNGLVDPWGLFTATQAATHDAHVITLDSDLDAEAFLESRRAASAKKFKNWRRLEHKLEREVGPLRVAAPDRTGAAFDQLIAWKRAQLFRTGLHDFLGPEWSRRLMRRLFQTDGEFAGLMITLWAGDRLVAGHVGVREGETYHPWLAACDPTLADYSPGQAFLWRAIAAMPELGLRRYDLGVGHDHYKRPYASAQHQVIEGLAVAGSPLGRLSAGMDHVVLAAGKSLGREAAIHSARRRLDQIVSVELSVAGRAKGVAEAFAGRARRRANPGESAGAFL